MALEASWNGERHCSLMRGLQSRHYDLMRSMRGCWFSNRQASVEPVVRLESETDFPVELETVLAEPALLALITSDTSSSASAVPATSRTPNVFGAGFWSTRTIADQSFTALVPVVEPVFVSESGPSTEPSGCDYRIPSACAPRAVNVKGPIGENGWIANRCCCPLTRPHCPPPPKYTIFWLFWLFRETGKQRTAMEQAYVVCEGIVLTEQRRLLYALTGTSAKQLACTDASEGGREGALSPRETSAGNIGDSPWTFPALPGT